MRLIYRKNELAYLNTTWDELQSLIESDHRAVKGIEEAYKIEKKNGRLGVVIKAEIIKEFYEGYHKRAFDFYNHSDGFLKAAVIGAMFCNAARVLKGEHLKKWKAFCVFAETAIIQHDKIAKDESRWRY